MDFLGGYLIINVTATCCCNKYFYPVLLCVKRCQIGALESICPLKAQQNCNVFLREKLPNIPTGSFVLQEGKQERITGVILMLW